MRFRFKLQRVLDVRRQEERVCQGKLAAERQKEQAIRESIKRLERERSGAWDDMSDLEKRQDGTFHSAYAFHQQQKYLEALERRLARTRANLDGQLLNVEKARLELVEASKRRRLLEKLHEKRLTEFKKKVLQAEQKSIDEVGQAQRTR